MIRVNYRKGALCLLLLTGSAVCLSGCQSAEDEARMKHVPQSAEEARGQAPQDAPDSAKEEAQQAPAAGTE